MQDLCKSSVSWASAGSCQSTTNQAVAAATATAAAVVLAVAVAVAVVVFVVVLCSLFVL